ncbi:MAG: hypothetical protein WAR79_02030 [Melioribacteraceae bacterium]
MKKIYFVFFLHFVFGCSNSITDSIDESPNKKILFYGFNYENTSLISTYSMDIDSKIQKKISIGFNKYPTWYNYPNEIILLNNNNYNLEIHDLHDSNNVTILKENVGNVLFLRYSKFHDAIVFSYKEDINKIAYYDLKTKSIKDFPIIKFDARNPIWSEKENYIYFTSKLDTAFSILKVSKDGSSLNIFLKEKEYELSTFDIDPASELLVASRYKAEKSFLTIYNIKTKSILYNIDVSFLGVGLYPTFTSDGKKVLFVNGIPNNYTTPRNLFIMNSNGTILTQLTFSESEIYSRPLNW